MNWLKARPPYKHGDPPPPPIEPKWTDNLFACLFYGAFILWMIIMLTGQVPFLNDLFDSAPVIR